jgi:hypothetical protein
MLYAEASQKQECHQVDMILDQKEKDDALEAIWIKKIQN